MFFGNVVPIPCRNFNYNFSRLLDGYLTAKARIQLQIGGHVKAIRFIVVVGGVGTLEGTLVGVVLFYLLNKIFSDYGTWYLVGLGLLAVVVTLKFPAGLWGFVSRKFDLHFFPVHRRLIPP